MRRFRFAQRTLLAACALSFILVIWPGAGNRLTYGLAAWFLSTVAILGFAIYPMAVGSASGLPARRWCLSVLALCTGASLFNLYAVLAQWPMAVAVRLYEADLVSVASGQGDAPRSVGPFHVRSVERLAGEGAFLCTHEDSAGKAGLVYAPDGKLERKGLLLWNLWGSARLGERWHYIEED